MKKIGGRMVYSMFNTLYRLNFNKETLGREYSPYKYESYGEKLFENRTRYGHRDLGGLYDVSWDFFVSFYRILPSINSVMWDHDVHYYTRTNFLEGCGPYER